MNVYIYMLPVYVHEHICTVYIYIHTRVHAYINTPFSEKYQEAAASLVMKQDFLESTGLGLPHISAKDLWMKHDKLEHKFLVPPIAVLPDCPSLKALSFHGVNPKLCVIAVVTALDDLRCARTPKSKRSWECQCCSGFL